MMMEKFEKRLTDEEGRGEYEVAGQQTDQDIKEIKNMLEEIRDDTKYLRSFMERYKIPEIKEISQTKLQSAENKARVLETEAVKKSDKDLSPRL